MNENPPQNPFGRLSELLASGPLTCTQIGERLWGGRGGHAPNRQAYARPAGRLVARAIAASVVKRHWRTWKPGQTRTYELAN